MIRMDVIRNEHIRRSLEVAPVTEKMRSNRLAWYGQVMRWDESRITKRVMSMCVDGHPSRGRPKKRWMECVKDDMRVKGVSMELCDRSKRKKKTRAVPT
jgi:hypothetical protein